MFVLWPILYTLKNVPPKGFQAWPELQRCSVLSFFLLNVSLCSPCHLFYRLMVMIPLTWDQFQILVSLSSASREYLCYACVPYVWLACLILYTQGVISLGKHCYFFILGSGFYINPANKETPHSFKGQQLENKLLYRFVIYMGFLEKYLATIWH